MPRPPKERRVEFIPENKLFKPAGIPGNELEEVCLNIEEVEAIRLKDLGGLNQEECSVRMNISRPTFQRILTEARRKVAEALIQGKAIRFRGGDYKLAEGNIYCSQCGRKIVPRRRRRGRHGFAICSDCEERI